MFCTCFCQNKENVRGGRPKRQSFWRSGHGSDRQHDDTALRRSYRWLNSWPHLDLWATSGAGMHRLPQAPVLAKYVGMIVIGIKGIDD